MKISFKFSNGTSHLILEPENPRDERYVDLCVSGRTEVKLLASKDKSLILEFNQSEEK